MNLKTNRLLLRELSVEDIPAIHQLNSIPEVDRYNTLGLPQSIEDTEKIILPIIHDQTEMPRPRYVWFVENTEQDFVGLFGLVIGKQKYSTAEIWYKVHPKHWGKGYATETVTLILGFTFNTLKLHRVTAGCATENTASIRVLEKCGFIREGMCRKILPIRGNWMDNYEYAILEEEYERIQK
ncbi:MAG: GNAT family N-acetyltransferase [Bacteroidetes bacterium B1(2017)]|nr:MAG: GNAT family N-acetyltransferase [Bacteroidetes bacterium B1(2017)]